MEEEDAFTGGRGEETRERRRRIKGGGLLVITSCAKVLPTDYAFAAQSSPDACPTNPVL